MFWHSVVLGMLHFAKTVPYNMIVQVPLEQSDLQIWTSAQRVLWLPLHHLEGTQTSQHPHLKTTRVYVNECTCTGTVH